MFRQIECVRFPQILKGGVGMVSILRVAEGDQWRISLLRDESNYKDYIIVLLPERKPKTYMVKSTNH